VASDTALRGYAADAPALIDAYEALDPAILYAAVADLFPQAPSTIVDIGAGTGRDAAWLARVGHAVTAVEPVAAFRAAGMRRHVGVGIAWLDDRLPQLRRLGGRYDVALLSGVWQHLDDDTRAVAIRRLAGLLVDGGIVILSIRHGPGAPSRPVFPCDVEATLAAATAVGFTLARRREAQSLQPANRTAGVCWTWLALRR